MKRNLMILFLLAAGLARGQADGFAEECRRAAAPVWQKALGHRFLQELAAGTLAKEKFRFYLEQDLLYLREFSRLLLELAAKAPDGEAAQTLARHAGEAIREEAALHASILGLRKEERESGRLRFEMAPTNIAYVNHLKASVGRGGFLEGMAAVLPCYWIYLDAGKRLAEKGSPVAEYQQWIRQYSGADYERSVKEALAIFDRAAREAGARDREAARAAFERSARYEWMFWEMAWRMERWGPEE
ncbi:MAG: thiaminase II [Bryobacteraceae bacterium]